jgi:hypothetical protein
MPGYYDEITGGWIEDGEYGYDQLDDSSGTHMSNDWYDEYISDIEFDQDWADVLGGSFMLDEVAADQDIRANAEVAAFGDNWLSALQNIAKGVGKSTFDTLKKSFTKDDGQGGRTVDWASLATAGAGIYAMMNKDEVGGYNKPVPKMEAVRQQIQYSDPNRRPGESGRQYFTDPKFATKGDAESIEAATGASADQYQGLRQAYEAKAAPAPNPYIGKMNLSYSNPAEVQVPTQSPTDQVQGAQFKEGVNGMPMQSNAGYTEPAVSAASLTNSIPDFGEFVPGMAPQPIYFEETAPSRTAEEIAEEQAKADANPTNSTTNQEQQMAQLLAAQNAINGMAEGGIADAGRYLQGKTDGMADKIPSSIDGDQPAALSHGEFVIPADVVSHLGNGNSEAGAEKLYEMMNRIRQARTGTTKQGNEINPDEFTMGGLANAYSGGGAVQKFEGGGITKDTSETSTLSPWVGEYVTDALGQGAALADAPYQAYQGPLTAGPSNLQQQAFAGASEMAQTGYNPAQFTGGLFNTQAASQYMNPYLQASLDPQLKELQRQYQINNMNNATQLTKSGAFGGSRQAVMGAENQRNMLDKTNQLVSQGYNTAYDKAMQQFNADQTRNMDVQKANEASRQFGANFAGDSIDRLSNFGATDRAITSEGLAADRAQFEEQRDFAYKMPQYKLNLLQGLPIGADINTVNQDAISGLVSDVSGLGSLYQTLSGLGQTPKTTTN